MTKSKLKKISIILYVVFMVGAFFFVRNALNEDSKLVESIERVEEDNDEIKPVRVDIRIETGNRIIQDRRRFENVNTVLDAIDSFREDNTITYEKVAYTYGTEFESINGILPDEGNRWSVFLTTTQEGVDNIADNLNLADDDLEILRAAIDEELDVTHEIGGIQLAEDSVIVVRQTKIDE